MKAWLLKRASFVGKSLLWSVLLYMAFILTFSWDDVSSGFKQYRNNLPVASSEATQETPAPNAAKRSVVVAIIKTVVAEFGKATTAVRN